MRSELQSWIPVEGERDNEAFEKGFAIFSLFWYTSPILSVTFGQEISNLISQPVFILLYAITGFLLYKRREQCLPILRKSVLLWVILLLPIVSTAWSDHPVETFRRGFAVLNTGLFGFYLATRYSLRELLEILKYTSLLIIGLSILWIIALPQYAIHNESASLSGAFRGIYNHKNGFASRIGISAIVFLVLSLANKHEHRWVNILGFTVSFLLLLPARSTTMLSSILVVSASIPFLFIPRWKTTEALAAVFGTLLLIFFGFVFLTQNSADILAFFGEDTTITGRSKFWPILIERGMDRFWIGYGFEAFFWDRVGGPSAVLSQIAGTVSVSHAHNGYLETFLNFGFLGLATFLVSVWITLLHSILKIRSTASTIYFFPILYLIYTLMANMAETSIFKYNSMPWVIYIYILSLTIKESLLPSEESRQA